MKPTDKTRKDSIYKTYGTFRKFLARQKIKKAGVVATFFLDKFISELWKDEWVTFHSEELISRKIIEKGKFTEWRTQMTNLGIIDWEGTFKRSAVAGTFNSSRYKPGEKIHKYINDEKMKKYTIATTKNLGDMQLNMLGQMEKRFDTKADKDNLERIKQDMINLENKSMEEMKQLKIKSKEDIDNLKKDIDDLTELLLLAIPPDTEERRSLIRNHIHNKSKCVEILKNSLN